MSERNETEFPELGYLFGCYLNEDYVIHGGGLGGAVRALMRAERPETVLALRAEIARFLAENQGQEDAALDAIDNGRAHPPGLTAADYLEWIGDVLAKATQQHAAE